MKEGWKVRPLGEVAAVGAGNPAPQDKSDFVGGKYPFIRTSDVGQIRFGEINNAADHINGACAARLRLVPAGTLLMPKSGASTFLNHRVITTIDAFVSSHLATITANRGILEPRFLFYAMTQVKAQDLLPENSYPSLNLSIIKAATIPLPPLEEQRRIVAVLDEAFEGLARARAHTKANLQNARELFEAQLFLLFIKVETDQETVSATVAEVAHPRKGSIRTGPFGSQLLHSEFTEQGIAVLGIDNAVTNEFRWSKYRFISPEKYSDLKRYTVLPGDVIITIMGTCGRCAVVPDDIPTAINTKHLCCISLDQTKCLPDYLHCYFLHSPTALEYLARNASGSVMDGLNMGLIKELPVKLPNTSKQVQVIEAFQLAKADTESLRAHYLTKLQDLDDLRQSLLQKAFAGELT